MDTVRREDKAGSGPGYLDLARSGELTRRARAAEARLAACDLCPHRCLVDRTAGERGRCRTGRWALVASAGPHHGEERPLVGSGGSGTVFFAACNLDCLFCQNAEISHQARGEEMGPEELAHLMLALQARGCENVNLVSPSHVLAQILEALLLAAEAGLRLPLVYNTGGYDAVDALALLDGVVDIYMPDMKFSSEEVAARLSGPADYVARNQAAVREMHRQVGDLRLDRRGVAEGGLLVRHLVLPQGLAGSAEVLGFLAEDISPATYLNLMDQYRPCFRAFEDERLARRITSQEYAEARAHASRVGLTRLDRG
jgi:putative pyruvate formate lyase activating enzyme